MNTATARAMAQNHGKRILRDPQGVKTYRVLMCAQEFIPDRFRGGDEEEVTVREFLTLDLPVDKVYTVAFCYAGNAARGGYVVGRHPIHFLRLDAHTYAAGSPFVDEPEATGRSILETLNKSDTTASRGGLMSGVA